MKLNLYKYTITLTIIWILMIPNVASIIHDNFLNIEKSWNLKGDINKSDIISNDGEIIAVDDDGDEDYTRIQDAIDNATSGDTIVVFSGIYKETLIIDKHLYLMGIEENDEGMPIIDAEEYEYAVCIDAGNCLFQGFNVTNSSKNDFIFAGIKILSNNNELKNNTIMNNYNGIWLKNSNDNMLLNNNISYSNVGVFLLESSNNTIMNNQINNTRMNINFSNCGIFTWYHCNNNIFSNNTIECDFNGDGIVITESSNNKISNNKISSYSTSEHNGTIFQYGSNGILLQLYSHNNEITNNNISDYFAASQIWDSNVNMFSQNYISSNLMGLCLYKSHKNIITHNNFINNTFTFAFDIIEKISNEFAKWILMRFLDQHATFSDSFLNNWNGNYWDDWPGVIPKPIRGIISRRGMSVFYGKIVIPSFPFIPFRNFDWHPLREPYLNQQDQTNQITQITSSLLFNKLNTKISHFVQRLSKVGIQEEDFPYIINISDQQDISRITIELPPYILELEGY